MVDGAESWVVTSQRGWSSLLDARRRASIATTMHWDPKYRAASSIRSGFSTAAVLRDTLSAPALRISWTS